MIHWCQTVLGHMRDNRSLLRTSFGEIEERPEAAISMCEGPNCAGMLLTDYVLRLQSMGLADKDADLPTAISMLMSSLFGDAVAREVMPDAFPQPAEQAPSKYVGVFLRAVGVSPAKQRRAIARSASAR
jgi:hypothetical protein